MSLRSRHIPDLAEAMRKLSSLQEGDSGVLEATAYSAATVPTLRTILRKREPSGIFEPRGRAVTSLAGDCRSYG